MPGLSGHRGAIVLTAVVGGAAFAPVGLLKDWERTVEESEINLDAQGDEWEDSEHLRNRWTVRSGYDFAASDYDTCGPLVGKDVLVVLQADSDQEGGAEDFLGGTARVMRDTARGNTEDRVTGEVELRGKGAPTILT